MSVDLDWPLNASSLLSASAELLVLMTHAFCWMAYDLTRYYALVSASVWWNFCRSGICDSNSWLDYCGNPVHEGIEAVLKGIFFYHFGLGPIVSFFREINCRNWSRFAISGCVNAMHAWCNYQCILLETAETFVENLAKYFFLVSAMTTCNEALNDDDRH